MELRGSFFTIFQIVVYNISSVDSAGFTDFPPATVSACSGTSVNLTWVYDNIVDVTAINWKFGIADILNFIPSTSTLLYGTGYDASRIRHDGNGGITLNATIADAGNYSCTVTYNSFPKEEDTRVLDVYNTFNEVLTVNSIRISKAEVQLFSSINDSSITYTWTHDEGSSSGTEYTARKCGNYRLTMSGGKSVCLATGLHRYSEVYVKIVDDTKLIACLFMAVGIYALLIVIGTSILCNRDFIGFDKLKADKASLAAIAVGFILVVIIASIIGWITSENCCKIGASIGSGFGIGLLIGIVILIIIYRRCRDPRLHVDNFSFEKIIIGMCIALPTVVFTGTQKFFVKWYFEKEEVSRHSTTIHYSDTRSKKGNVKEIEDSNRFSIKTSDNTTSLTILNAQENDTGKYYAVFEGLGTAEIKIHVEKDTKVREERNMTSEHLQSGKSLLDNVPPGRQLPPGRLPPIER